MTCLHCDGWTCARCASPHDVAAAGGGAQSLTAAELEVVALRKPRMFPLQAEHQKGAKPGPLSIPWSIAEAAYGAYAAKYGRQQSLERLAERGGFAWSEMDQLHPGWRTEVAEIDRLRALLVEIRDYLPRRVPGPNCVDTDHEALVRERAALCRRIDEALR